MYIDIIKQYLQLQTYKQNYKDIHFFNYIGSLVYDRVAV